MGRLLGLLLTAVAVAAAKPLAPRPAASPWAAEPPTAEQLRSLHGMLPQDEEMSDEEAAAIEAAFRAQQEADDVD